LKSKLGIILKNEKGDEREYNEKLFVKILKYFVLKILF